MKLPKLEWVVYQMSPRVVNRHYGSSKHRNLLKSPGFAFDREHAATTWEPSEDGEVTVRQLASVPYVDGHRRKRLWGWKTEDEAWDNPKMKKVKRKWRFSRERWKLLESMIRALNKRGLIQSL